VLLFTVRPLRDLATKAAQRIHPKLGRLARGVLSAFEEFSPGRKIGFLGYGIVFQLRPLIVCYLLFLAFNPARMPSLQEFLAYGSVVVLMSNVPLTVAGIGPREAALTTLFATYASDVTLLSVGILMSFSIHVVPAILGIPFMFPLLRALAAASPGEARVTAPRRAEGATPIPEPVDQSVER